MHLYSGSTLDFLEDSTHNRIAEKVSEGFERYFRYQPGQSEVQSWRNSLRAMADVVRMGDLTDNGIIVELQLPLSSRRLDCMVTGTDDAGSPEAVIVELKQWEQAGPSWVDDCVSTFVGGGTRDVLHPSAQVGNYERYLLDVHSAFSEGAVALKSCAFLHNMRAAGAEHLADPKFAALVQRSPVFTGEQVDDLVGFLDGNLGRGGGHEVLETVLRGGYRPHKRLLDHVARMIGNDPMFVLLDDQQVAFNAVLSKVRTRQLAAEPSVILVKGGPGTGKSVLAVNLVAELARQGLVVHHATGSKAFTEALRKRVGNRASALFKYFNSFGNAEPEAFDVLICDESHRIRETSNNRFTKAANRSDRSQIAELVSSAKVSVFFIDDLQVVRPGEIGSSTIIQETATEQGARLHEFELETQFRCGGSDSYVRWVANTLEIDRTPDVMWNTAEEFDFQVVDAVEELDAMIRSKGAEGFTARLAAGFCWKWSDANADGTLVNDVKVGGWSMPWNAKPESRRLAPGIPKASYWATDPGGIDQVGCVYTAQGFEYDYAGVIFGRDLVYRSRDGWVGQPEFSHDSVVKRAARRDPAEFTKLVKHTYRVLLTRCLLGCYVFFDDYATLDFLPSRM
ncbi:MAG: DUF2075 domain-containing protein [Actinomycetota bacterium]